MRQIKLQDWKVNPFTAIGKEWMLITASNGIKTNTMTASWGGLGVIWNFNVAYIFVRQSRYTKEFLDTSNTFSLCFFDESERKTLSYLGTASGRNEDKISKAGYHIVTDGDTPYFKEAHTAVLCTKLSSHPIAMEDMPDDVKKVWYQDSDYHDMYIARIDKVLVK